MEVLADGRKGKPVPIEDLVKACGVKEVRVVDPYRLEEMIKAVKEADGAARSEDGGVCVIISRHPCLMTAGVLKGQTRYSMEISDDCANCGICHEKFECPAIGPDPGSEKARIDLSLCSGCGVCVDVCPKQAIKAVSS
jgi:indolepyruvate ferredoxin oxidoreductase alpha subunit